MTKVRKIKIFGLVILMISLVLSPVSIAAAPSPDPQVAPPFAQGELLLKVKPGVSPSEVAQSVGASVQASLGDGGIHLLSLPSGSVPVAVEKLNATHGVAFAEPNWLRQLHGPPDDGGYDLKWDLHNDGDPALCDGSDCPTTDADMDWQEAYDHLGSDFSGSAVVAVIDTGIDASHPDLDAKLANGYDYLDGDADPKDTYGHGTHVAGIALAETNNGQADSDVDTAGVGYSPNIQVMPLRVCSTSGCPTSAIVDAIYHAADNGANVINLSLGGKFGSSSEEQAINYAWGKGLVIAASSGNDGSGKVSYPAAFANAIAVGSTNWHDQLAPYSNKGNDLDVVAPGGDMSRYHDPGGIYSTMPTYDVYLTTSFSYSKNYDQLQGTSMAAPQVSGLAALLFAMGVTDANGNGRTNDEVRSIIEMTADDLGSSGWDRNFGWGRVNVHSAVLAADGGGGGGGNTAPTANDDTASTTKDTSVNINVLENDSDPDGDLLTVTAVTNPTNGTAVLNDDDTITYTPDTGFTGTDSFTYDISDGNGGTDSATVTVTVSEPAVGVTVSKIDPNSVQAGASVNVTITGSGFQTGADVTFENGSGPAPTASSIVVVDGSTITANISAKSGGPPRDRVWDVRVTNPDGSTGVLAAGFTVTP